MAALTSPANAATSSAPAPAQLVAASHVRDRANAQTPAVTAAAAVYVAVPGDTLSGIAAQFCGSWSAYPSLAAGNRIPNPDLIYVGQAIALTCNAAPAGAPPAPPTPAAPHNAGQAVADFALAQVGKPYVWAAAGPNAYDCSGLVVAAFARLGIYLPHYTESQMDYGRPVSRDELQPGDVIMPFHGHVVIYVGGGRVVEAADYNQGVRTNNVYAFLMARRYV